MITSKAFTIETRLNPRDNAKIIEYTKEYSVLYGKNNVATGKSNLIDYYRYSSGLNLFPEEL